jgi:hypothetical protein
MSYAWCVHTQQGGGMRDNEEDLMRLHSSYQCEGYCFCHKIPQQQVLQRQRSTAL